MDPHIKAEVIDCWEKAPAALNEQRKRCQRDKIGLRSFRRLRKGGKFMVMTILEAYVERQHWNALISAYNSGIKSLDPGIVQTFLVQSKSDPTVWRIMTLWEGQEALDTMRQSGETPRGVLMFRSAEAQPVLSVFEVHSQASTSG